MKKILLLLAILLSSTLFAEKHALLVGVNSVRGDLQLFTDIDIKIMERLLKRGGFKIHKLLNKKASLANIRVSLKKFDSLTPNDTFLFYYTGHGAKIKGANHKKFDNIFVLSSTYFSDVNTIGGGILTDKEFSKYLYNIKAKKVTIVDSCYSGTIYKSISSPKFTKSIAPKDKGLGQIFNRAKTIPSFKSYRATNLINISASHDNQRSENSPKGSIFTIALDRLIRKYPNITFSKLNQKLQTQIKPIAREIAHKLEFSYPAYLGLEGKFKPKMYTAPSSLKNLALKDIFLKPKPKPIAKPRPLKIVLEQKTAPKLTIETSDGEKVYKEGYTITFDITSTQKRGYLYLFEEKEQNYTFLGEKELINCQLINGKRECQFDNIFATKPFGKTVAYAVITKQKLKIHNKSITKDFIITQEFFDEEVSLAQQIKKERVAGAKLELFVTE